MRKSPIRSVSKKRAEQSPDLVKAGRTLKSTKRVKVKNPERTAAEFARAYESAERVEWVKSLPCVIRSNDHSGPIENAHIQGGGGSRKADARFIVPMCHGHHQCLHTIGPLSFLARYKAQLYALAQQTQAAWEAYLAQQSGDASRVLGGGW